MTSVEKTAVAVPIEQEVHPATDGERHAYLTTAEVAELLRTPVETIRYWRHIGKGPRSFKIGRRVLYDHRDIHDFVNEARNSEDR
ncbi:DNA-binding protein [Actinobacteria bacterium YIM 96077]|uniref:DNA-binding protein n=1 Tax=Phytoactinopolyspora halophila TaxID=1981511 RepID=A0A329QP23_9ACTN|nr:helix-turn-helix domain-containing protein [Phytoactinopolyspora halophila]AYY14620.1 DNA-binding protein [Actinobacteria bacterium YIM 96077]RAW14003.1 DNA-binding protein [Phytoactinopolyspora halophila]